MTKRSKIIVFLLAAIFVCFLEIATINVMKYNLFFFLLSIFFYFINILFIEIDAYFTFKGKSKDYNYFSLLRNIGILGLQLVIFYLLGNVKEIQIYEIFIIVAVAGILVHFVRKFSKLAQKNSIYFYTEE